MRKEGSKAGKVVRGSHVTCRNLSTLRDCVTYYRCGAGDTEALIGGVANLIGDVGLVCRVSAQAFPYRCSPFINKHYVPFSRVFKLILTFDFGTFKLGFVVLCLLKLFRTDVFRLY